MNLSSAVYTKSSDIVFRKIAGEVILVPIRDNVANLESIYTLNEVACRIWELIDGHKDAKQLGDIITEEYVVQPEIAEKDLSEFLSQATELRLITSK